MPFPSPEVLARPRELACLQQTLTIFDRIYCSLGIHTVHSQVVYVHRYWLTMELEMTKIARIALIANPLLQSRGEIAQANDWGEGCAQLAVPPTSSAARSKIIFPAFQSRL